MACLPRQPEGLTDDGRLTGNRLGFWYEVSPREVLS
jgi:hypothetical protein